MIEPGKKKLDSYLDQVCAEVRARGMHREIREELSGHFADLMQERQQLGASEAEAEQYAISQMGDPQVIGRDLHHIHKPRIPWGLLAGVVLLSAVSLLGMWAVEAGVTQYHIPDALMLRQAFFIVLGISVMTGMYFINFKQLQRASGFIYGVAVVWIVASIWLGPETINGTSRYALFMGFPFDLIGYSPYLFVVALAGIWSRPSIMRTSNGRTRELADLALLLFPAVLYMMYPSYPELVVYLAVSLTLYIWMTCRWVSGVAIAATFIMGGAIYVWNHMNLRDRLIGALNHNYLANGPGYLNRIIYETLISAGWRGQGVEGAGDGLAYAYTDLFPVLLIQCFGWAGGLLLLALTGWFVLKMISYARAVSDTYGRMLIIALILMLSIRTIYGLSILSGRMPLISIPFPFLSYGQHVLIEFAAAGLLMGVYRRKDMLPATPTVSKLWTLTASYKYTEGVKIRIHAREEIEE